MIWYFVRRWLLFQRPALTWPAEITYADIERVKRLADVDLCGIYAEQPAEGDHHLSGWEDVLSDVGVTVNVLRHWLGWGDFELRRRSGQLDAATIQRGVESLEAAMSGFFLALGRGPMFGILCRSARAGMKETQARYSQQAEDLLRKSITEKFGGLPESPESVTPGPTSGGNSTS